MAESCIPAAGLAACIFLFCGQFLPYISAAAERDEMIVAPSDFCHNVSRQP